MRSKSNCPSVLPHWLGVESIQILRDIVWTLKNNLAKSQKLPSKVYVEPIAAGDDESGNEEEWDKEDVEEIQGILISKL
jgi:hypothetical protein